MPSRIVPSPPRALRALLAAVAISLTLLSLVSAAASAAVPLTPFLDCVHFNGDPANPVYTAYFGYNNTGAVQFNFAVGDNNQVFPGGADQGQPTAFNVGNYPRVFAVQFDGVFIPNVTWDLNGLAASASVSSPACAAGVTTPASGVDATSATLNGVVAPDGQDTTYSFEYGTAPSFGRSTPTQDAGAGTQPQVVQAGLTGLMPSTQYFFRLDTTNALAGTTTGRQQSFTTPATRATGTIVTAPLTLSTSSLPDGTFGMPYSASLAASGGSPIYTWSLAAGSLPGGLSLAAGSGTISGAPTAVGTSRFTAKVVDAGTPSPQAATQPLSITIDPAATNTRVTSSANPAVSGRSVTYTATVSASPLGVDTPTGNVAFTDNGTPVNCSGGSQTLNAAGVAICTLSDPRPGYHSIIAAYGGNGDFVSSRSQPVSEVVKQGQRHHHSARDPRRSFAPSGPRSISLTPAQRSLWLAQRSMSDPHRQERSAVARKRNRVVATHSAHDLDDACSRPPSVLIEALTSERHPQSGGRRGSQQALDRGRSGGG